MELNKRLKWVVLYLCLSVLGYGKVSFAESSPNDDQYVSNLYEVLKNKNTNIPDFNNRREIESINEKQFKWLFYGEDGELESDIVLKLSTDGTLYISGGSIENPISLYSVLDTQGVNPQLVTKIVIEDTLCIKGFGSYMFGFFEELRSIENLAKVDVSGAKRLDSMFMGCEKLQELDLSNFDLSNYDSDLSGMFAMCEELRKVVLGPNYKLTSVSGLTDPPQNNPAYTGKWRAVGTGTERRPEGLIWESTGDFMMEFEGEKHADTYVWEPVPATIRINYIDANGMIIHTSINNTERNVGETYDVTTSKYQLMIPGYKLDESKIPKNATGSIVNREEIVVTYVYISLGNVVTKFINENDEEISPPVIQIGAVDDAYVTEPKEIVDYEIDETKTPANSSGTYTKQDIIVTYTYRNTKRIIHARQIILGQQTEIVVPTEGYTLLKSYQNLAGQVEKTTQLTVSSSNEEELAFDTRILNITTKAPYYTYQTIVPMYYQLKGYIMTTTDTGHLPELAIKNKPEMNFLDNQEYWITTYFEPTLEANDSPNLYHWDYKENKLGEIKKS